MDAATTIRLFEYGVKLSLVGVFNSIFLFPVYKFAGDQVTMATDDPVKELSLSNMKQGNLGTIATTVAAYIIFGVAMHLIDKDFEWFTSMRHRFLAKKRAQNYSLFISSIPESLRNDEALQQYFRSFTGEDVVIDGDVALDIPKLEKKVARREALCAKLEHAINVLTIKKETPMHKTKMCGGEKVESIPAYIEELDQLNKDISEEIDRIAALKEERGLKASADPEAVVAALATTEGLTGPAAAFGEDTKMEGSTQEGKDSESPGDDEEEKRKHKSSVSERLSSKLSSILAGDDDGKARTAAFVTFKDLASTNLARQAVHSSEPWEFVPAEPPNPQFVNWKNVGKGNHKRKMGQLISLFLTILLCVFWTIPVSFIASLSNVEALTEIFPFLLEPVLKNDWFANLLAQLAPLILTVFISLLPHFLLVFVKLECLVEIESMQHPSLFSKLAFFTLIQTFFISTISGSLWSSIEGEYFSSAPQNQCRVISRCVSCNFTAPFHALTYSFLCLSNRHHQRSYLGCCSCCRGLASASWLFYIQLILVQNLLAIGLELLRISPVVQNMVRKIAIKLMGFNLTEKERSSTFMGIRSLSDPLEYYFGRELGAKTILLMMVLYVYSCMAPITSYFTLLVFLVVTVSFRNQFIYVYPIANDSGGKLWINFTKLSIISMIIAEIILLAVILLKEGYIAGILLVPLIIYSIIFDRYFRERHYLVTAFLPAGDSVEADMEHEHEGITYEWLSDQYLQPALKVKETYPPNFKDVAPAGWVDPNKEGSTAELPPSGEKDEAEFRGEEKVDNEETMKDTATPGSEKDEAEFCGGEEKADNEEDEEDAAQ